MTEDTGKWLLALASRFGSANEAKILKLDVCNNDALVWIIAKVLQFCWTRRASSKKADLDECIGHLIAETEMMKDSHFVQLSQEISIIMNGQNET